MLGWPISPRRDDVLCGVPTDSAELTRLHRAAAFRLAASGSRKVFRHTTNALNPSINSIRRVDDV
jgi:hypothetical protein